MTLYSRLFQKGGGALGPFSIMCIDDHDLVRAGIGLIVTNAFPDAGFRAYSSLGQALEAGAEGPDVLLLDLHLEGVGGHEAIPLVKLRWPAAAIIVVTSEQDHREVERALNLGADQVVLKSEPPERFVSAIRDIAPVRVTEREAPPALVLSPRQLQILRHLQEGLSNKAIARRIDISEYTVRGHVQQILKALNASSRAQAVFEAQKAGVL